DSTGAPASKLMTLSLSSGETVTCTVSALNSAKATAGIIGKFMGQRADLMLSQGPDGGRQIDRLNDADGADKTGEGEDAADGSKPATSVAPTTGQKVGGGRGSFEQRLSELKGDDAGGPASGSSPFAVQGSSEGPTSLSFSTSLSKAMGLGAKTKP